MGDQPCGTGDGPSTREGQDLHTLKLYTSYISVLLYTATSTNHAYFLRMYHIGSRSLQALTQVSPLSSCRAETVHTNIFRIIYYNSKKSLLRTACSRQSIFLYLMHSTTRGGMHYYCACHPRDALLLCLSSGNAQHELRR